MVMSKDVCVFCTASLDSRCPCSVCRSRQVCVPHAVASGYLDVGVERVWTIDGGRPLISLLLILLKGRDVAAVRVGQASDDHMQRLAPSTRHLCAASILHCIGDQGLSGASGSCHACMPVMHTHHHHRSMHVQSRGSAHKGSGRPEYLVNDRTLEPASCHGAQLPRHTQYDEAAHAHDGHLHNGRLPVEHPHEIAPLVGGPPVHTHSYASSVHCKYHGRCVPGVWVIHLPSG